MTERYDGNGLPPDSGWKVVAAGPETTDITDGHTLLKVHQDTVHLSEAERLKLAEDLNRQNALARERLGELAVPALSEVGYNPLNWDTRAVVTTQPYTPEQR